MIRVIRICRKCGDKIFADAPEGLCARCVLKSALARSPEIPVAGVDSSAVALEKADGNGAGEKINDDATGAPASKKKPRARLSCRRVRRLRIARRGRSRQSGRGFSGFGRKVSIESHQPWSVGERGAPEMVSPGGESCCQRSRHRHRCIYRTVGTFSVTNHQILRSTTVNGQK